MDTTTTAAVTPASPAVNGACNTFRPTGYRLGSAPANEGDEYLECRCGRARGEHADRPVPTR